MSRLQTKRTTLRRFRLSDLPAMMQLDSDPDIMKFTPSRVPQTPEQSQARLKNLVESEATHAPLGVWAAELKDGGDFVGWFMLRKSDMEFVELGFMIAKKHWNMGLTTEISQTLLEFSKRELNLPGLSAVTDPGNIASIRVLEKLGFKLKGTKKVPDKIRAQEISLNVYELLF